MFKVPPRFELGSLDSESRVLTITPWNPPPSTAGRSRQQGLAPKASWFAAEEVNVRTILVVGGLRLSSSVF